MSDLEQLSRKLSKLGYWPHLRLQVNGWHCILFDGIKPSFSPPTGDGATALEALQAADSERVKLEGKW